MLCKATKKDGTPCAKPTANDEEYCGNHLRIPKSINTSLSNIEKNISKINKSRNNVRLEGVIIGVFSSLLATLFLKTFNFLMGAAKKVFQLFQTLIEITQDLLNDVFETPFHSFVQAIAICMLILMGVLTIIFGLYEVLSRLFGIK